MNDRFAFGANWARFLNTLTDQQVALAEQSVTELVGPVRGKRFLDAGSGSGLFSLAASRLGAVVHSFDYDPQSVACTEALRRRYGGHWTVEQGSVLNSDYLSALGQFDVVYSWGVLHHTGDMRTALQRIASTVVPGGNLVIAIYNDQGAISRYWLSVKRLYTRPYLRPLLIAAHSPHLFGRAAVRAATGRLSLERGMSLWHDYIDWLGGYPFEVAKPESVVAFFRSLGFTLEQMKTCGGRHGCNEFVFTSPPTPYTSNQFP